MTFYRVIQTDSLFIYNTFVESIDRHYRRLQASNITEPRKLCSLLIDRKFQKTFPRIIFVSYIFPVMIGGKLALALLKAYQAIENLVPEEEFFFTKVLEYLNFLSN
jgi:hypothetical protein